MYLPNKYTRTYYNIINRALARNHVKQRYDGYHVHHIIPRSFGGSDDISNLVTLTFKEHKICHRLLIKMTAGELKYKMMYAYVLFDRLYDVTGIPKSKETRAKMSKPKSLEHAAKIAMNNKILNERRRGKPAHNKGISGPMKGVPKTEEHKANMRKPKRIINCPHCHKQGGSSQMKRWHFANCKMFTQPLAEQHLD